MAVGTQSSVQQVDLTISQLALGMRNLMTQVQNLYTWVNGQGNGLGQLEALGYGSGANPANLGGVSDAQEAINMIAYLNTVAGVYFGTATQAAEFDFNNALAPLWAGQ